MTISVVARCESTGHLGVALATGLPAGGAHCIFAFGGVGAVASQAYPNPYLGLDTLRQLRGGVSAGDALATALADDPDTIRRQVIVVDTSGRTAGHTGAETFRWRGHRLGDNVAVAANMVPSERVTNAMWQEFEATRGEELWWRLAKALVAGEAIEHAALRPCRSAAVRVVSTEEYPLLEVRVDSSADPIHDLLTAIGEVERTGLVFTRMLPTRSEPAGRFDVDVLDARGLMPEESESSE